MYSNTKWSINLLYLNITRVLFYSFPLCFIIGNLAVSINTFLFLITSLFLIQREKLNLRFDKTCWILVVFFVYLFISTTIHFLSPGILHDHAFIMPGHAQYDSIIKSMLMVRFIILIFIVDTLIFNKILDLKKLFLFSLICTSFVSFDIILQFITGTDLFGYKTFQAQSLWNSGPFGDEKIAGGYLKNFSFLSFFYIFIVIKNKNFKNPLLIFVISMHLIAALLAGNRMPIILFLLGCFLIALFIKNLRPIMILSFLVFISFFSFLVYSNKDFKDSYLSFFSDINIGKLIKTKRDKNHETEKETEKGETFEIIDGKYSSVDFPKDIIFLKHSGYNRIYRTSIIMWKEKPLTGFGLKSFRIKCWYILKEDTRKFGVRPQNIACGNHSHNYYLQLLSESGIIGITLIIIFFLIMLKNSFACIKEYNQKTNSELIFIIPFIISIFLEIWPIRSSGSFFTNWNATFFWLNVAIFISIYGKNSIIKK